MHVVANSDPIWPPRARAKNNFFQKLFPHSPTSLGLPFPGSLAPPLAPHSPIGTPSFADVLRLLYPASSPSLDVKKKKKVWFTLPYLPFPAVPPSPLALPSLSMVPASSPSPTSYLSHVSSPSLWSCLIILPILSQDRDNSKSVLGFIFILNGRALYWKNTK